MSPIPSLSCPTDDDLPRRYADFGTLGDALKLRDEASVQLGHGEQAEVLLFDLPKNS